MNDSYEKRYVSGLELRAAPEGSNSPGTLVGYPIVFDSPSEIMIDKRTGKKFREIVKPGACDRCMKTADIRAMADHDTSKILGRSTAGTMRYAKDDRGVRMEVDLPDTTVGRDTAVSVGRRDITGMSFGFTVARNGDSWDRTDDIHTRHLIDIDVDDFSVVAYPAYVDTEVAMRSLERAEAAETPVIFVDSPENQEIRDAMAEDVAKARREYYDKLVSLGVMKPGDSEPPAAYPEIAEVTPEPAPEPDPEAVRREIERDRDRLRMLGVA